MSALRREILSLATDDFTGVWEVAAIVASLDSALDESSVVEAARGETLELVNAGMLDVFVGPWGGEPEAVSGDDAMALIGDRSRYVRPPTGPLLAFVDATTLGDATYFADPTKRPGDELAPD